MGAKLGKTKTLLPSKQVNGIEKEVTTVCNTQNGKTSTLERKPKKKDQDPKKKSFNVKVDKGTSTDGEIVSSSAYIRKLVAGSGCHISYDSLNAQSNSRRHSDAPSRDVQELREACIRRGIITPETSMATLPTSNEQAYEVNIVEESTYETSTPAVANNEEQVESHTSDQW